MELIYLDNNATTRPDPQVVEAMLPYLRDVYANPSSVHRFGQQARKAVDDARARVAQLIGAAERQITFTSGGTESVNTALRGILATRSPRRRIVTSAVEHSASHELCARLAQQNVEIVQIPVGQGGQLDLDHLSAQVNEQTAVVNIMWANNETGVLCPVQAVAEVCRRHRVPFHCDATQAVGKIPVDVNEAGVDAMSFAAHKFHGPKGVAAMYLRRGLRIEPLLIGGPQENNRRGGTENVPGIVGMGVAAELARQHLPDMRGVGELRNRLEQGILQNIPQTAVNGNCAARLPNTTNIGFLRLEAEAILMLLSEQGICASAGAACSSGSLEPSHVLQAMRLDPRQAHGAIRFSLSRFTTATEIQRTLELLPPIIARLRQVLPV